MGYEDFMCISCSSPLNHIDQYLECPSCSARYPTVDGIPLFGHKDEVEQWTQYHIDPNNARHVASGGYISEKPSPHNAYYSRFIPDEAKTVLDAGGGMATQLQNGQSAIHQPMCTSWI